MRKPHSAEAAILLSALTPMLSLAQSYNILTTSDSTNASSYAALTIGPDGNFYGTTSQGRSYGTVFKLTPNGIMTTLHAFTSSEGNSPYGGLVYATDGNFYGTTVQGGSSAYGTVYQISPGGAFVTIYNFTGSTDGSHPYGKLVQASDGQLYGVTSAGGSGGVGTAFKITGEGTITTLHSFASRTEGGAPRDGLFLGNDGNFYGTTSSGGTNGLGTVFRMNSAGLITTLHNFASSEGNTPYSGVIQASDGNFYGTTYLGGAKGDGTVYSITAAGKLTTLYSFSGSDGKNPGAALVQGVDGNLYGTTYQGGNAIYGTIFTITTTGSLTMLHSFTGSDGQYPAAAMIQGANGIFYGSTYQGGANNKGVFFRIGYTAPAAPAIASGGIVPVYSTASVIQSGEWVSIYGSNLATSSATWVGDFPVSLGGATVSINGKPAYLWYASPGQINAQAPDDTGTGSALVRVTTANGSSTATVTLAQFAPSFCLLGDNKHVAGIILRSDGSGAYGDGAYDIIGPTGTSLGYKTVAAKSGDNIALYGVGLGPTNPSVPAGQPYTGAAATANTVSVSIDNLSVAPAFSGLVSAGLYQLNLVVPSGLGTGDIPVQAAVGGIKTPSGVVISLQ